MTRKALAALALTLIAGCSGPGSEPTLTDAQQVIADVKFPGSGAASDLTVAGAVDRRDARYHSGDTIALTVTVNRPASVAVLRVLRNGVTTIVFPSKAQSDARAARQTVHVEIAAGKEGAELFEFIAATDGAPWLFTRKPEGGADYVELGNTSRALATDIATTFRGARHGTVAVAHQAIRVRE